MSIATHCIPAGRYPTDKLHAAMKVFCLFVFFCVFVSNSLAQQPNRGEHSPLVLAPEKIYEELNAGINSDDVYRVELLVFANNYPEQNDQTEEPMALHYPEQLLALFDLAPTVATIQTLLFEIEQQEFDSLEDFVAAEQDGLLEEETSEDTVPSETIRSNDVDESEEETTPIPLLLVNNIDPDNDQLKTLKRRMMRQGGYRVLFHNSWYQALDQRTASVPILVNGGRITQQRHELEGTIKISRDRFLHVEPDFWLTNWQLRNTPTPWYLTSSNDWSISEMPEQLNEHPAIVALRSKLESLQPDSNEDLLDQQINRDDDITSRYRNAELLLMDNANQIDARVNTNSDSDLLAAAEAAAIIEKEESLSSIIPPSPTEVHLLQEKRRVKRDEIHYFDHPMFGAVVVINRL